MIKKTDTNMHEAINGKHGGQIDQGGSVPGVVLDEETLGFRSARKAGLLLFVLVFGVFGGWATLAPIEGAAHAPGLVSVKSYKKQIEHLEGGIVEQVLVTDGDKVNAGDVLLVLDDTQALARLKIANSQYLALLARETRLKAERDGLESPDYPAVLRQEQEAADEIIAQDQIFRAGQVARDGSREVLEQRIEQLESRVAGMIALRQSRQAIADSWAEDIADFSRLRENGFTSNQQIRELERNQADLLGEIAELDASISATRIQAGETQLQILQQDKDFRNQVVTTLSEVQGEMADLKERMVALEDVVRRTEIKSPVDGVVDNLQVHTLGAVIEPGTTLLDIVPQSEDMVIEAKVSPMDIDRVALDQAVTIRFSSFSGSVIPIIDGRVFSISADSQTDELTGTPYYLARVEIIPESLENLRSQQLVQGMPADTFIATGSRTLMQYLFKPLSNGLSRSLIED